MTLAATAVPAEKPAFHVALVSRREALVMLTGAAVMLSIAMGLRQSLGLFQTPLTRDLGMAAADSTLR